MENSKKLLELKKRKGRLEITVEDLKKDLIEYEGRLREVKEEIEKEMKKGNSKKRKRSEGGVEGKENKRKKQNKKFKEKLDNLLKEKTVEIEEIPEGDNEYINLAQKYEKAEKVTKEAKNMKLKEIEEWYEYAEQFKKKLEKESKERPFVKELTIRKEVYKEITKFLPKKEGENIRKKTQKSEKLWKIIEEIGGKEEIKKLEEFSMNEIINWKEREVNLIREKIFFEKGENEESETEEGKIIEMVITDKEIEQKINGMTEQEVQELINEIGGEIGNISGTTTPLEEGS